MIQTTPQLDGKLAICGFPLSTYILLPDSFGDIYYGETFNAYIAVVNGLQNQAFYSVSLSIRLQTANSIIDLKDTRHADANSVGSDMKVLGTDASLDAIVHHVLSELGTHTLRVSVAYMLAPSSEVKTLRKFYRFNVLQPLVLTSYYLELGNSPMIQCEMTNSTKSSVFIEDVSVSLK
jgi:hypothetical protein